MLTFDDIDSLLNPADKLVDKLHQLSPTIPVEDLKAVVIVYLLKNSTLKKF